MRCCCGSSIGFIAECSEFKTWAWAHHQCPPARCPRSAWIPDYLEARWSICVLRIWPALHRPFLLEAVEIAVDRGHGQQPAVAAIAHQAIARLDITLDLELVPPLGMTDI